MKFILPLMLGCILLSSCYYDNEEDLYASSCNIDSASYAADIAPIIAEQCIVCHNDIALLGGLSLSSYQKVKIQVDNGKLLGSIRHDTGFSPMPQGLAKLPKCDIERMEKWIMDGALDN